MEVEDVLVSRGGFRGVGYPKGHSLSDVNMDMRLSNGEGMLAFVSCSFYFIHCISLRRNVEWYLLCLNVYCNYFINIQSLEKVYESRKVGIAFYCPPLALNMYVFLINIINT